MNPSEFRLFVKLYRQQHTKAWRLKNNNPAFKMLYPFAIEETYAKEISAYQQKIVDLAISRLSVVIPKLYRKDVLKEDADTDELEQILNELEQHLAVVYGTTYVSSGALGLVLEHVAEKIFGFENLQYLKITKVVAGMPLSMSGAPWWPAMKANWEATNYNLIKSLSKEYITKLNSTLLTGFQSGWSQSEMVEAIQTLSDKITTTRANLIARDQIGKLTSFIAEAQDLSYGSDGYIWQTARDEKVRGNPLGKYPKAIPSHWQIDYVICRWSNSTIYSEDGQKWMPRTGLMPLEHPGRPVACRCQASPYFLPFLSEIDRELEEAE
jgi:hypothetical protein